MTTHDLHWTFGTGCHISFPGGGDPVVEADHGFVSIEGCATVSDGNGNLLFYTDGASLYDSANSLLSPLGGSSFACHSAIIVPPAGGGSLYHVFTLGDWDNSNHIGPLHYSTVSVAGGVALASGPVALSFGSQRTAEKLAAISHTDCDKYWVVSVHIAKGTSGAGELHAMLIDSDLGPSASTTTMSPYPWSTLWGFCQKFSPDGTLLAIVGGTSIDILNFDRTTGAITPHSQITGFGVPANAPYDTPYGVEFSPNGQYLYFTSYSKGYVNRHTIGLSGSPATLVTSTARIDQWIGESEPGGGSLQLAPNGKIYGTKNGATSLFVIDDPNSATATPAGVQFQGTAPQAGGGPLTLNRPSGQGLPVFTRISRDCQDRCKTIAAAVDRLLTERGRELQNHMVTCAGEAPVAPSCARLDIPEIRPQTYVSWGDSRCDCIEGDDTEIMQLTLCNPYSNLTLSGLTVHELVIVDDAGQPVSKLPNGDPSIQLVPIGPYCFGDIAPCSCVTREFVLRLRGAPGGRYRVLVRGICFDASVHGDTEACFAFEVCRD